MSFPTHRYRRLRLSESLREMVRETSLAALPIYLVRLPRRDLLRGFVPGLAATFLGKAVSGIGIYKRQTSRLAKEFEA